MKIKERFKRFKSRLTPLHAIIPAVCAFLVIGSIAIYQYNTAQKYRYKLENQYVRAVNELTVFVDNIKNNLAKGVVATDPREMSKLANRIYSQSAFASAALGQLPVSDVSLANTSRFLSQVGDFTHNLSLRYMDGNEITDEEYETLLNFNRYATTLNDTLTNMQSQLYSGTLSFSDAGGSGIFSPETTALAGSFEDMEQQFADYPSLIYDGPFSDHIQNLSPALLEGKSEITAEEAAQRAAEAVGTERNGTVTLMGETGGVLPSYSFSVSPQVGGGNISVDITKKGGMISWMLDSRAVTQTNLTIEDAKNCARSYISARALGEMKDTYYEIKNNTAVINFACFENGVMLYPDLVKIRVALDTGEITGAECHGYIMNHKPRQIPEFTYTDAQVLQKLSPKVTAVSVNKCLVPTESNGEIFCYEIRCGFDGKEFLIYLNSTTLRQEDILMLLVNENGSLTI